MCFQQNQAGYVGSTPRSLHQVYFGKVGTSIHPRGSPTFPTPPPPLALESSWSLETAVAKGRPVGPGPASCRWLATRHWRSRRRRLQPTRSPSPPPQPSLGLSTASWPTSRWDRRSRSRCWCGTARRCWWAAQELPRFWGWLATAVKKAYKRPEGIGEARVNQLLRLFPRNTGTEGTLIATDIQGVVWVLAVGLFTVPPSTLPAESSRPRFSGKALSCRGRVVLNRHRMSVTTPRAARGPAQRCNLQQPD